MFLLCILLCGSNIHAQTAFKRAQGEGNLAYSIQLGGSIYALAGTLNGESLAIGSERNVYLVDFNAGYLKKELNMETLLKKFPDKNDVSGTQGYVSSLAFSDDGSQLAVGCVGGLFLVDIEKASILWYSKGVPVTNTNKNIATTISQVCIRGNVVYSVSPDEAKVYLWDLSSGKMLSSIDPGLQEIEKMAVSWASEMPFIACTGKEGIWLGTAAGNSIWTGKTGEQIGQVAFSNNNEYLAASLTNEYGSKVVLYVVYENGFKVDPGLTGEGSFNGLAWGKGESTIFGALSGHTKTPVTKSDFGGESATPVVLDENFGAEPGADKAAVYSTSKSLLAVAGVNKTVRVYADPK